MQWVFVHLPHLLPPIIAFGFLIKLGVWAADQPPQHYSDEEVAEWRASRELQKADRRRRVRPVTARLGLAALVPLIGAFGTGLAIYTFNLRGDRPSAMDVWVHTAMASIGLALVTAKVLELGWRRIRRATSVRKPQQAFSSLVLLALGIPLIVTGIMLLVSPSGHSATEYFHLIASVWWVVLFQWHLWRYFGRAIGAATGRRVELIATPPAEPGHSPTR
jgi:hypothetical protein